MKIKKHLLLLLPILLLMAVPLSAQDISFKAIGQTNVAVGNQFIVQFVVNAKGSNFKGPDFDKFRVLTGPNQSTNTNYSNINGRMTQSTTITYSYYLRALSEGTFTIAPAKITIDGKEYQTNELKITVGKKQAQTQTQNTDPNKPQQVATLDENAVFIKAIVDKKNPYLGEQVILSYKIYTKVPISNITSEKEPNLSGFWMKNLIEQGAQLNQSQEIIDGVEYVTADLRKFAIFPQKSGKITISPLKLQCVAQVKNNNARKRRSNSFFDSFFDDPFFSGYQNIQKFLESNQIVLNIKPLPQNGKPTNFNGAIGSYTVKSEIDNTSVKTNDAITIKYKVSGQGNIELIDKLDISFPTDFEVYDPKITDDVRVTQRGVSGSRTFEYLIIPRNPGEFTINAFDFSFFNPITKKYEILKTKVFNIQVEKGEDYQAGVSYSGISQEDIQYIGQDIRHIRVKNELLQPLNYFFYGSLAFILWYLIPALLFIIFILFWRKQAARLSNQSLMRHKKATKIARKNLKKANQYLGTKESEAFYNEISQALWGYLADKFNIPLSELSKDSVEDALNGKEVMDVTIKQFIECLNNCDFARFAPGDPTSTMDKIYNEALEIISKIERELR